MDCLKNRVALVTGSSRGIGAAIAKLFAQEGAKVALHGRDAAVLSDVLAEVEWAGGLARPFIGDATSSAISKTCVATLSGNWDRSIFSSPMPAAMSARPARSSTSARRTGGRRSTAI